MDGPATALRVLAHPDPGRVLRRVRNEITHKKGLARLRRALFYHRMASGILLANELGLFAAWREPQRAEQVARRLAIHPRAALALLRILEAVGLVRRSGPRFEPTPLARVAITPGAPDSMAPMLDLMSAQARAFDALVSGVTTGVVPPILDIFSDQARCAAFLDAVNGFIDLAGRDLLGRIELPPIRSMIVGSMGVSFSALLLDRCPQASVTYGCLEHLVREIPRLRERYGVDPGRVAGSHVHGGDPNADRWGDERFDLVFLTKKMILDPENRVGEAFARKAFDVLTPNGVAILWETVHPADAPTPVAQAMEAMLDLGASPTGFVLTDRGLVELLTGIGFVSVEIVRCLGGSTSFIIARR